MSSTAASSITTSALNSSGNLQATHTKPIRRRRQPRQDEDIWDDYDTRYMDDLRWLLRTRSRSGRAPMDRASCIDQLRKLDSEQDREHPYEKKYERCSEEDLQRFIKSRTGVKAPANATRDTYAARLRQLDAAATFRFMDLPLELRQIIYEELLFDTDTTPRRLSTILSTTKEIRVEVKDMIHKQYPPHIKVEFGPSDSVATSLVIMGVRRTLISRPDDFSQIIRMAQFLRSFPRLTVDFLSMANASAPPSQSLHAGAMASYAVASVLATGSLDALTVVNRFAADTDLTAYQLGEVINPLAVLFPHTKISFQGFPTACEVGFSGIQRPLPSVLTHWLYMGKSVADLLKRLRTANPKSAGAVFLASNWNAIEKARQSCWFHGKEHEVLKTIRQVRGYMGAIAAQELKE